MGIKIGQNPETQINIPHSPEPDIRRYIEMDAERGIMASHALERIPLNMEKYAIFYFSIIPGVYLFDIPDRTTSKLALFLALSIPFLFKAAGMLRRGEARLNAPLAIAWVGFLAAVMLSGMISLYQFPDMPAQRLAGAMGMAAWMISFLAMAISCETRCLKRALRSLTISTLVSAGLVYGLDKSFHFITRPPSAQLSLGMNSISLGKLLLAAVPGALLMNRHVWRLLLLLLISALIFMTGARTIAIALAITILVFILINDGYNRKILRNIVLVLVAGATIGVMGVISRGIPLSRLVTLDTLYLRAEAWANALTIWWRMNPVTGVGPGMHRHYLRGEFRLDHLPYSYPAGHAHSEYLAALADLGVLGFLAWGGLLTVIFLALWKRRKENSLFRVSLAILVGYLVASLTEVHFMRLREMTLVIVVMVMGFAAMVIRTSAKHS